MQICSIDFPSARVAHFRRSGELQAFRGYRWALPVNADYAMLKEAQGPPLTEGEKHSFQSDCMASNCSRHLFRKSTHFKRSKSGMNPKGDVSTKI